MINPKLQDYLWWKGKLSKIVGLAHGPIAIIESLDNKKCPECGEDLGKDQEHWIINSPAFQEGAEPIQTIK